MSKSKTVAIKIVLVLAGLYIVLSGMNIGFGGIETLGWGGQSNFVQVTDMKSYLIQDSHVRFVGGVWLGVGLLFILSVSDLKKYKNILYFCMALVFIGGLMRIAQMHFEVTFGPNIIGPVLAELIGMPLLYLWFSKTMKKLDSKPEQ